MTQESTALAIARVEEIDRKDDDQIIAHMSGELVDEYVYSFQMGNTTVRGLSWAGIREMAQERGNIHLEKPDVQETDDYIRVMVKATDLERNVSVWGGTHQPKMMKLRDGGSRPDDFAFEKAVSKGQRNAIKNLMPVTVVRDVINRLTGGAPSGNGSRKAVSAPRGQQGGRGPGQRAQDPWNKFWTDVADIGKTRDDVINVCGGQAGPDYAKDHDLTPGQLLSHCKSVWSTTDKGGDTRKFDSRDDFLVAALETFSWGSDAVVNVLGLAMEDIQGEESFADHWATLQSANEEMEAPS